jgi:SpoVK/Ycf46/Vps4 family AAA+-type ATPase
LEDFPGVVILATNMARVMDQALDRRVDIAIEFEFPDAKMREEIFRKTLPGEAPVSEDVDFAVLARKYTLSGGHILNVVRQAMRYAARRTGGDRRITMDDLIRAAEREIGKSNLMRKDHLSAAETPGSKQDLKYYG